MAKSDARRTKGQAKPGKERDPPGAVRAREDAKTDRGGGERSDQSVYEHKECPDSGEQCWTCPHGRCKWLEAAALISFASHNKSAFGCTQSIGKMGMETGNDSGGSEREGTEAKGGERAAGVSKYFADPGHIPIGPELDVPRGDYDRGLHRAAGVGATGAAEDYFAAGYAVGCNEQDWPSARRTYRWAGAAFLIGLTLGLLLPLAYQMVSRG